MLGQRLLQTSVGNTFLTVQVASAAIALTSFSEQTFADIFDELEELKDGSKPDHPSDGNEPWDSNEVLD